MIEEKDDRQSGGMKAPIGRRGGKRNLALRLIEMFPDGYNTYVEPFVGGGQVFYRTPKVPNEIINDLDKDMYIIHKGLRDKTDYIQKNINRNVTKADFDKLKTKTDPTSVIARYRASFLALGKDFNSLREGGNKADYTPYKERLKGVKIFNKDYSGIIKKYDSSDTFFYLDPPYEPTGKLKDYKDYVEPMDLFKSLQRLKGKFMLSYNDSPNIRKIFSKYKQRTIKTKYWEQGGATKNKTELLITNY